MKTLKKTSFAGLGEQVAGFKFRTVIIGLVLSLIIRRGLSLRAAQGVLEDFYDAFSIGKDVPDVEGLLKEEQYAQKQGVIVEAQPSEPTDASSAPPDKEGKEQHKKPHDVPSYVIIKEWCDKAGYHVCSNSQTGEGHLVSGWENYAIIVDESISTGGEKLLLILGVNASHGNDFSVSTEDVEILFMGVSKSWKADDIKNAIIEEVIDKIGKKPLYGVSDNGSNVKNGIKRAGLVHHRDIAHTVGTYIKKYYSKCDDLISFEKSMTDVRLGNLLTEFSVLLPPNRRAIEKWMNVFDWVEWADSLLKAYPLLNDKQKEKFSFVLEGRALVEELARLMNTIRVVQKLLKNKGLSSNSSKEAIALT